MLGERDPRFVAAIAPAFAFIAKHYLRLQVEDAHHLRTRPALIVANHNGGIAGPDLICTLSTLWQTLGTETPSYALAHDFVMRQVPALGSVFARAGALRATRESARAALGAGASCLVYPGGDLEAYRLWSQRNRVIFGERTGFVAVAQELRVPIVPLVAAGAHRSAMIFSEGKRFAQALRMKSWARLERFPIAFALPWGVARGPWAPYLPLPFPIRLRALPPVVIPRGANPAAAREDIRVRMQRALDEMLHE